VVVEAVVDLFGNRAAACVADDENHVAFGVLDLLDCLRKIVGFGVFEGFNRFLAIPGRAGWAG
jgi:hypothetical protein